MKIIKLDFIFGCPFCNEIIKFEDISELINEE